MTFSKEWESIFSSDGHRSVYPWSNVVGLVTKYARLVGAAAAPASGIRVLELGCGVGANITFFLDKGWEYHSIEGSETAVAEVTGKYAGLVHVRRGDFTKGLPYGDGFFDCVVDRSSTVHNRYGDIKSTIGEVRRCLKPSGLFFALDWFSADSYAIGASGLIERNTIGDCGRGYLSGCGVAHFFDEDEVSEAFSGWEILYAARKTLVPYYLVGGGIRGDETLREGAWDIVVRNVK